MRGSARLLTACGVFSAVFALLCWLSDSPDQRELEPFEESDEPTWPRPANPTLETPPPTPVLETPSRTSIDESLAREDPSLGPHWNLRAIDDASREPVAAANVYFFSPRRIAEVLLIDDPSVFFSPAQFYSRYGLPRTTNELGLAEIPQADGPFWIVAMTPTRFGGATLDPTKAIDGQFELALLPSEFLEARVLSASDRKPLSGVAVALRDEGLMGFPIGAKSDAQGLARLGPFAARTSDEPARFVTVHGLFSRPVEAWARAGYAPMAELLVPNSERLLVRIVDSRGKVCAIDGELALDWSGRPKSMAQWVKLPIRAGTVAIPRVELGLALSLRAELNGAGPLPAVEFTMPNDAHDQRFDLALDSKLSIVHVKLIAADQRPIGPASWWVEMSGTCNPPSWLSGQYKGVLRGTESITFALGPLPEDQCEVRFGARVHSVAGADLGGFFRAVVRSGTNDLRTWVLEPASLLCSGRVVDSRGYELPLRAVELEALPRSSIASALALPSTSGPDGRFEIRGWADAKDFTLSVRDRYGAFVRTPAGLGQTELKLVIGDD